VKQNDTRASTSEFDAISKMKCMASVYTHNVVVVLCTIYLEVKQCVGVNTKLNGSKTETNTSCKLVNTIPVNAVAFDIFVYRCTQFRSCNA